MADQYVHSLQSVEEIPGRYSGRAVIEGPGTLSRISADGLRGREGEPPRVSADLHLLDYGALTSCPTSWSASIPAAPAGRGIGHN